MISAFRPIFANWKVETPYERADRLQDSIGAHERVVMRLKDALKEVKHWELQDTQVEIDSIDWTLGDVLESLINNMEEDLKCIKSSI